MRWLEISPGFACNCRCTGCYSCSADARHQMDWPEVLRWLQTARRQGAKHLWLSGGEPTLRKDFLATLRAAKHLGFERIKVQTNAMLFSYPEFTGKAVAAGMNEANLLIKSLDPRLHDAMNRTPGAFALLDKAVDVLGQHGVRMEGDFLMTTRNYRELPDVVTAYASRGLKHFNIWLFSLVDQGDADLARQVPKWADAMPFMLDALERAEALGATLTSLNTPHCVVPPHAWRMQFNAAGMGLTVVNPGGHVFQLETSSIEQGVFLPACSTCAARHACHGMRSDYIGVHGSDELQPLSPEQVAHHDPRGSVLELPDLIPANALSIASRTNGTSAT